MQSIYYGTAETAASILPRASWAYDNDAHVTAYDPQQARRMLKEAGVDNLQLKLWVPTASQSYNPAAENRRADPGRSGPGRRARDHRAGRGRFQEARLMEMNHDLTLTGWATDSNDPDSFFRAAAELRGNPLANQLCSLVRPRF
ncbi:Dipeptide-binding protein [Serratia rubidaea]|uniref:Dipeptide-binding protein n=1 Tax=Serratia rubidaea TaxID=61652 RepID=A0A447QU52_SERRU|nr:Dipeptide-binding protein [Serratia rubidaea]